MITGLGLFLLEVASRRIAIDPARLGSRFLAIFGAAPVARSAALGSLSAAKARAAASMKQSPQAPARSEGPIAPVDPTVRTVRTGNQAAPSSKVAAPPIAPPNEADPMARLHAAKKRAKH